MKKSRDFNSLPYIAVTPSPKKKQLSNKPSAVKSRVYRSKKRQLFNKPSTVKKRDQRSRHKIHHVIQRREKVKLYTKEKRKNESFEEWRRRLHYMTQHYKKKMNESPTKMTTTRMETMKEAIEKAVKEGKQALHRTVDENDPSSHRANVCIICDCFIIGTDSIKYLKANDIRKHKSRIGVDSYNAYYKTTLHPDLVKHYKVPGLDGLLLSPSSKKTDNGYVTCSLCFSGMNPSYCNKVAPPKYSIANGFVIGSIPKTISFKDKDGELKTQKVDVEDEEKVNEVLRAYLAPIRPYGCIFAYSGGAHQAVRGHYSLFEMDQSNLSGVMNCIDPDDVGKTIYCMSCGRMTPNQKEIIRKRAKVDSNMYKSLLSWFIQNGHPGYKDLPLPQDAPTKLVVLEDRDSTNNTDTSVNEEKEKSFEGGTYYFSSAQEPSDRTSVYETEEKFALAMMNRSTPTLLAIGGQYAKSNEINVENVLPFAFPYGIGGPKMNRR